MQMMLYGGPELQAAKLVDFEEIVPGIGRMICPECGGDSTEYADLFPPELGITNCVDCKGTGYILVNT